MYFDLNYNDEQFIGLTITPDKSEDPNKLHNYANSLVLKNPAIIFSEMAKAGDMNVMSDEDYAIALENIKIVSSFFDAQPEANIFHVLDKAITYILSQNHSEKCNKDN